LGKRAKINGRIVEAVDVFVGGRSGPRAEPGVKMLEDVPCDALEAVLEHLVTHVARDKTIETVRSAAPAREEQ
jgi:ferredoxin-nitrite reductase